MFRIKPSKENYDDDQAPIPDIPKLQAPQSQLKPSEMPKPPPPPRPQRIEVVAIEINQVLFEQIKLLAEYSANIYHDNKNLIEISNAIYELCVANSEKQAFSTTQAKERVQIGNYLGKQLALLHAASIQESKDTFYTGNSNLRELSLAIVKIHSIYDEYDMINHNHKIESAQVGKC